MWVLLVHHGIKVMFYHLSPLTGRSNVCNAICRRHRRFKKRIFEIPPKLAANPSPEALLASALAIHFPATTSLYNCFAWARKRIDWHIEMKYYSTHLSNNFVVYAEYLVHLVLFACTIWNTSLFVYFIYFKLRDKWNNSNLKTMIIRRQMYLW